ncbi:MAG: ferrous iron transport protein B [Anaerolineaceae bacterium]|nr:ferrous iron transport protein B [Anaerolineaceae bacterium]
MNHQLAYSRRYQFSIDYGREIEQEIVILEKCIETNPEIKAKYPSRWLAIKLLEQDENILEQVEKLSKNQDLLELAAKSEKHLSSIFGDDVDTMVADRRYGWINGLIKESMISTKPDRLEFTDQIDKIVTNRILGLPIFFAFMWLVFKFTTEIASPLLDFVDFLISGPISRWMQSLVWVLNLENTWIENLLFEGVIAGVGGVLAFVPVLMALYMALAFLEDSGYMARAAFVMDRFMHVIGLHGKSFLPMIVAFGCTVPAFYATRTLENEKDRILTGLLVPFMSCSARLPVYVLFAAIFFPGNAGTIVFWMYMIGILVAVLLGLLYKRTLFKTKALSPFVMELPPYRMPTLKAIWIHTWERTSAFVRKAWSLILVASVIIWLLLSIPVSGSGTFANTSVDQSAFAAISRVTAPIFKPAGFGSWKSSGALISGLVAKEVVVSTLHQTHGVGSAQEINEIQIESNFWQDLGEITLEFIYAVRDTLKSIPLIIGVDLFDADDQGETPESLIAISTSFEESSNGHGKLAAFSFMIFVLLYTPCIAAISAERHELGVKWMWFSIFTQLFLAWLLATLVFQGGIILGLG